MLLLPSRLRALFACVILLAAAAPIQAQIERPFTPRFFANVNGDFAYAANTSLTCDNDADPTNGSLDGTTGTSDAAKALRECERVLRGANPTPERNQEPRNNRFFLRNLDIDNDASTFNSSSSTVDLPAGATVLWAGLYWGTRSENLNQYPNNGADLNTVKFDSPSTAGYQYTTVTAQQADDDTYTKGYFAEVTALVQQGGTGLYTVADVDAKEKENGWGAWTLIVAYEDPSEPLRNLSVFDGSGTVQGGTATPNITVSPTGFTTPLTGPFAPTVGVVLYDGDRGKPGAGQGDFFSVNGTKLSDANNPVDDFGNATISILGQTPTGNAPFYQNNFSTDVDVLYARDGGGNNLIANGDNSADVTIAGGSGEGISIQALTFASEIYVPEVQMVKTMRDVNGGQAQIGDVLEYTIVLENVGEDEALQSVVTDPIPPNTTYQAGTLEVLYGPNMSAKSDATGDDEAEYDAVNDAVVFRVGSTANSTDGGTLAKNVPTAVRFRVTIDAGTPDGTGIFNQALLAYEKATLGGGTIDILTSGVATNVVGRGTDLVVEKSASVDPVDAGETFTYTLDVRNDGPEAAADVTVSDQLPMGVEFVSASVASGAGWSASTPAVGGSGGLVMFMKSGALAINETASFEITVRAKANLADQTVLRNAGRISSSTIEVNASNNVDSAPVTVNGLADLRITKTAGPASVNVGQNVSFTLTLANDGPNDATGVTVRDQLPAGLTFVSASPAADYDAASGIWTVGMIGNGATRSLFVTARVDQAGPITNVAQVASSDQPDPDSAPNNDGGTQAEDDEAAATVTGVQADLALTKTASSAATPVGQNVTFTLMLSNSGPSAATGVRVTDRLPAGLTFVSANPAADYNSATGVWTIGNVANGGTKMLQVVATVTGAGPFVNVAEVTASDQPDPDSAPGNNDPSEDDQGSATVGGTAIDLSVTKTVMPQTIRAGENATYTVTVRNDGSLDATGVVLSDVLPTGLTFVSDNPAGDYNAGTSTWAAGSIPIGTSKTLIVEVTAASDGSFTNTAQVSAANEPDLDSTPGNNDPSEDDQDSALLVVTPLADLSVTKTVDNSMPVVGSNVVFTVTVRNDGPSDATGVEITDPVVIGLDYVSDAPSQGSFVSSTGVWTVGALASGASATLQLTTRVTQIHTLTNTAQVTASDQPDPDSAPANGDPTEDDQSSVNVNGTQIDLSLDKSASPHAVGVGSNTTFTLAITNSGTANATGVEVTDQLPAGLTFVSATPAADYNSVTGSWTVGSVAIGQTKTLEIVATVTGLGPYNNIAQVTAADQPDADSTPGNGDAHEDDQDNAVVSGLQADLSLGKLVNVTMANVGDNVVYTVVVTNAGPTASTGSGISVGDQLPPGVSFGMASESQGSYDAATGIWTLGALSVGQSATLTVVAQVTANGPITNVAEIIAANEPDPNSTPNNNDPTENDQDSATINANQPADLSIAKSVSDPAPTKGDVVTFSVSATNGGPAGATGVVIQDVLPVGLTFVGFTQQPGVSSTYDPGRRTITWTLGALANAATETLMYTASVDAVGSFTNVAQVTASDQTDPDSAPGNDDGDQSEDDEAAAVVTSASPSGGGGAGVESDGSLATLMAQRLFVRRQDIALGKAIMAAPVAAPFAQSSGKGGSTTLADLVPSAGPGGSAALDVTPGDLLGVTNARDVVAADYVRPDGRRIGALFGALSPGGILYDHAKATCDRLGGGRMEDVRMLDVDGNGFVLSKLIHSDGAVDFAASFVAYRMPSGYVVESRFSHNQYDVPQGALSVVNFQVWSAAPVYTAEMVRNVLAELAADAPVMFRASGVAPSVYVVDGGYANGAITLRMRNTTGQSITLPLTGSIARSETTVGNRTDVEQTITVPAPAEGSEFATVRLDVGPIFDGSFVIDDARSGDQFYFADGTWSYVTGEGTSVSRFETFAAANAASTEDGTFAVERAAVLAGRQGQFASLFRYLRSGGQAVDLSSYSHLEVTASGMGRFQVALEKASIEDGAQQFVSTVDLTGSAQTLRLPMSAFARVGGAQGAFEADDVTLIAFYPLAASGQTFEIAIESIRIVGGTVTAIGDDGAPTELTLLSAPNPARDHATIRYGLPQAGHVHLEVFDLLGRSVSVLVDDVRAAGTHPVTLDASSLPAGTYLYRLVTDAGTKTATLTVVR